MNINLIPNNAFFARLVRAPDDSIAGSEGQEGNDTVAEGDEGILDSTEGDDTVEGDEGGILDDDTESDDTESDDTGSAETIDREAVIASLPEGYEAREEQMNEFLDMVEGAESRQDLAQKMLGMYASLQEEQATQWNAQMKAWADEVRKDPDLGGDNLDTTRAQAKTVAQEFGGKEFLDFLKISGGGNHPAVIRFLTKIHAELPQEGKPVTGAPQQGKKSLAERMFPES